MKDAGVYHNNCPQDTPLSDECTSQKLILDIMYAASVSGIGFALVPGTILMDPSRLGKRKVAVLGLVIESLGFLLIGE